MRSRGEWSRPGPRRPRRAALAASVVTAVAMSVGLFWSSGLVANGSVVAFAEQLNAQRRYADVVVMFEFEQTNATSDEITILFTSAATGSNSVPKADEHIDQQFTFSGRDYPKGAVSFSRRVGDKAFLNSRFIRVVNRGTNRWFPTTVSMTVDGQRILDRVSMYPRKGRDPKGGLERWGKPDATFWETDLQRFRQKRS